MTNTNAKILAIQEQIAGIQKQLESLQSQLSELIEPEPTQKCVTVTTDEEFGDRLATVVWPAPTKTPEPPAKKLSEIQATKQRFAQKFNKPIEEVTVSNVRHRLLNEVWDWGADGLIDATWLKGKNGKEFWQQVNRIIDKIERKAKQSA